MYARVYSCTVANKVRGQLLGVTLHAVGSKKRHLMVQVLLPTEQGLLFFCFLMNCLLLLSKQTATDSSSNSSQKREPNTRTISSPTSCEHRRIYTLDPYPMDLYHPDQVSRTLHASGSIRIALP